MAFTVAPRNSNENFDISPDGTILYVAGNDGHLRAYDVATGALLNDWAIGLDLDGIAISRDGRYAVVTEAVPVSTQQTNNWTSNVTVSAIYLIDLRTGSKQVFEHTVFGSDYTFGDVAYSSDNVVLISQNILPGWSGWAPILSLNLATGQFAAHGSYYAGLGSVASLTQREASGTVLVGQLGLSSAEYFLLNSSGTQVDNNGGSYANAVYGYAQGVEAFAGTGATGRIAIVTGGSLHVYDGDFNYIGDLSGVFPNLANSPGITFNDDGSVLYAIDPVSKQIIGIAMDDYFLAETIPIGDYNFSVLGMGNELTLAPDGQSFLIATTGAVISVVRPTTGIRTNGDDYIVGTNQADELSGGPGNDTLIGLAGNDLFSGGPGNDTMIGGPGDDDYLVDSMSDLVFEDPNNGIDLVHSKSSFYLYANIEILQLATGAGAIFGVGNDLANVLLGNESANVLIGLGGNDEIRGGAGNDQIFGGEGDNYLYGDAGVDYIVGGSGVDTIDGGTNADEIYGLDGNDILGGGTSFDTDIIVGGNGNDTIYGDSGLGDYDLLFGMLGDDKFYVDTPADLVFEQPDEGTDTVYAGINGAGYYLYANIENLILTGQTPFGVGNELANILTGNIASNWLLGGAGNDTINGKGGADVLFGEAGSDMFVFDAGSGADVIGDFNPAEDTINLDYYNFASFAALQAAFVQNGAHGAINLGGGNLIVLHNVTMANLDAGDFIL